MQKIEVFLGEDKHTIRELPRKLNAEWRERLTAELEPVADFVTGMVATELQDSEAASEVIQKAINAVNGGMDLAVSMLQQYAPDLDVDWEEGVYDSQIIETFMGVLGLAYPFGKLAPQINRVIQLGRR